MKGGVAIYKHGSVQNEVETLNVEHRSTSLVCEVSAISIQLCRKTHLHVLGIYRPPNQDKDAYQQTLQILSSILQQWMTLQNIIFIVGDFNVDCLKTSREGTLLSELLAGFNMTRINLEPTRITPTTCSSIDMCCVSADYVGCVDVQVLQTGISDHTGQLSSFEFEVDRNTPIVTTRRHINKESLENLRLHLELQNWDRVLTSSVVDEAYNNFLAIVISALDATCPAKTSKSGKRKTVTHAFDTEANSLKQEFLQAENTFKLSGREEDKRRSAELKKTYDLKLRSLRRETSANFIAEASNKPKAIWNIINAERQGRGKETSQVKQLVSDNVKIDDPQEMAEKFNEFFTSVAEETLKQTEREGRPCLTLNKEVDIAYSLDVFEPTSKEELSRIIRKMKNKTSVGLDEFSSTMLKKCEKELTEPLVYIINLSLKLGVFPKKMKSTKVIPLHKQGSKQELGNYRPISLVSTFSKVVEKVIHRRISDHLVRNSIQLEDQHGFLCKRSTLTALVELIEYTVDRLEEGHNVCGVYLDLSKAFDCLGHNLILTKLSKLGFRDIALNWFNSYLLGRDQLVELKHSNKKSTVSFRSRQLPVSRGVPQGSVLGPVIFILFTYDLPEHSQEFSKTIMYADDSVLLSSSRYVEDLEIKSYTALNLAIDYCNGNDLVFNAAKTKQLVMGSKRDEISEFPGLQLVDYTKHLGLIIDGKLSWAEHLNGLCSKLSSAIFALIRVKAVSNIEAVRATYHSIFESHLRYGIVLWGSACQKHLERVLVIQKRAVRVMADLDWNESCQVHFKAWKILTVMNIYILEVVSLACTRGVLRNEGVHQHNTRFASNFNLPTHHSKRFEMKPTYAGARLFNLLPEEIRKSEPKAMKGKLHEWLLQRPFYSVKEFMDWAKPR